MSRLKELLDLSKEVKEKEQARFDKFCAEFGMWRYRNDGKNLCK